LHARRNPGPAQSPAIDKEARRNEGQLFAFVLAIRRRDEVGKLLRNSLLGVARFVVELGRDVELVRKKSNGLHVAHGGERIGLDRRTVGVRFEDERGDTGIRERGGAHYLDISGNSDAKGEETGKPMPENAMIGIVESGDRHLVAKSDKGVPLAGISKSGTLSLG
jgi:hypothetical protein